MTGPAPIVPRYQLGIADRIVLGGGRILTCKGMTRTGYILQPFGTEISDHVSFAEFEIERQHPDFRQDTAYYTEARARARARTQLQCNDDIPVEELPDVRFAEACVKAFLRLEKLHRQDPPPRNKQRVNRTGPGFAEAMRLAGHEILQLDYARREKPKRRGSSSKQGERSPSLTKSGAPRKIRVGTEIVFRSLPGSRTLQTWLGAYEDAGCELWGLRQCNCNSGNHLDRYEPDEYALLLDAVDAYMSRNRFSYDQCYDGYTDALAARNTERAELGLPPLRTIGKSTYRARVRRISLFKRDAARYDLDYAIRRHCATKQRFDVTQIGELVQIDGCQLSLIQLCVESGVWATLTPEQQAAVPRERWYLLRAFDVASRCILAELLTPTETTRAAITLLRLMINDKTPLATAMGANTPWEYACLPRAISPDGAWAFRGEWTRQVLADLGVQFDASQIGQPNRRSHVERSFGTTRTQFLSLFSGQTFANIADKGSYDAVENASLFVDELAQALVIYDVDVYHNSPHEGLNGETPRNAWIRLMRERGAVRVVPGAHQQRSVFGVHLTRTLSRMGIRVFGLHYQSEDLARVLANKGGITLPVRLDVDDLGWISVQIGKAWVTVPCATSGLEGASVRDWLSVVKDQRRRYKIAAAASRPIVAEALRKIRAIAAKAERRFTIAPHTYNAAIVGRAEEELFRGFDVPVDLRRSDLPPDADPLAQGIPVTGPVADPEIEATKPRKPRKQRKPTSETPPPGEDGDDDWIMETPDV